MYKYFINVLYGSVPATHSATTLTNLDDAKVCAMDLLKHFKSKRVSVTDKDNNVYSLYEFGKWNDVERESKQKEKEE